MSQSIDERIVDLQFNNKQFETGVEDTLKSLDNLKKGLNLEGAGQSLEGIGESASKLGFNFSALEVMAVTALAKITSAVIDFGVQVGKSLILDPITDGFREYELKMQSVQTIMVNTAAAGTTMADVTKVLDELNDYADQTVYSFSDMTQAMSRLTASGVKLNDAAGAIKGISNLTAAVGGSAQNSNTAFLQLGQSIASGRLQYQDWRSVMQAGLGGPVLQNELMAVAVAAGEMDQALMDAVKNGEKSFTELIRATGKAGPAVTFSTDTMLKALNNLAEDPSLLKAATEVKTFTQLMQTLAEQAGSQWARTWESIIGNKDEAVEVWTAVNNAIEGIIGPLHDGRNATMALWKEMGGRDILIEGISNAFKALLSIIEPITKAFGDIFPPITAQRLIELTEGFRDFTASLAINEETADKIQRTFAGLFAVLDLVGIVIKTVFQVAGELLGVFLPLGDGVLGVTAGLGDFIVALRDAAVDGDIFGQGVEIIGEVLDKVKEVINKAADGIKIGIDKLKDYFAQFGGIDLGPLKIFSDETRVAFTPFTALANLFKGAWEIIVKAFEWAAPIIGPFAQQIGLAISKFAEAFGEAVRSGDLQSFVSLINTGLLGTVIYGIKKFIDSLTEVSKGGSGFLKGLTDILDGVRGSLETYQNKLKAETLIIIAGAIAILVGALWVLSGIDGVSLATGLAGITTLFAELATVMIVLSKNMGPVKMGGIAVAMIEISVAVLILANALKTIADIDSDNLGAALLTVGLLLAALAGFTQIVKPSKLTSTGIGLIGVATALLILTQAVEQLGGLKVEELAKGLTSIGILLAEIAGFSQIINPGKLLAAGAAMIPIATGLLILSGAMKVFGSMSWEDMAKGLISVGVLLTEIGLFTRLVDPLSLLAIGLAIIPIATGLTILSASLKIFGSMSWEELAIGMLALGGALAGLAVFTNLVNPLSLMAVGVAMIPIATGITIMAGALKILGSMNWDELAKGLVALGGALLILAVAANAMTGALAGAAAMVIMAAAIMLLVPSIVLLGSMDLANIGLALLALAGTFAVIGVAGLVLGPLVPVLLGLAAAIALLGVGALAIGAGLLAFSAGLTALAVAGTAGAAALATVVMTIIQLIPAAVTALAEGLLSFIQTMANGSSIIMESLTTIVLGIIQIFIDVVPKLGEAVSAFLETILSIFVKYAPKVIDIGIQMIVKLLEALINIFVSYGPKVIDAAVTMIFSLLDALLKILTNYIPKMVTAGLEILTGILNGIAKGIPGVVSAGVDIIVAFLDAIGKETARIVDAGFKMIIDFVNGLADAIRNNTPTLVTAFSNLASAMIEGLVGGLFGGIKGAVDAIKNLGSAMIEGFKGVLGIHSPSKVFEEFGEDTVDGYTGGVDKKSKDAEDAVKKMADAAINKAYETFDIASGKSKIFEQLGVTNAESFIAGLNSKGEAIKESLKKVFGADEETLNHMTSIVDEALKTIEDRITSYTNLATDRFNRISTESEISVEEMITNLKHNQMAIAEWADNIALLAERGLNEGLLEELRKAGPASAGEVKALVAASDTEIQELNTVMAKGGQVATQALATSVGQGAPLLVEPGQSLVDAVAQGLTSTSSVNDAMALLIDNAKRIAIEGLSSADFSQMGKNISDGLGLGISSNTSGVTTAATTMADEVKRATTTAFGIASPSTVYDGYGDNLMTGLAQGITSNSSKPLDALDTMFTNMAIQAESSGQKVATSAETGLNLNSAIFGQTGNKYGTDFANSLLNTQTAAGTSGQTVGTAAETGIKHNELVFGETGSKYGTDFSNELFNKQLDANTAGRTVSIEAERGIKQNVGEFRNAGVAAGQGFTDGLISMIQAAAEAAARLAREAVNAARKELKVKSPSREFQEIGVFSGLGFINGLLSMFDSVSEISANLGSAAIDGLKNAINKIADVVNQDMEYSPTITPVLDLSNIQNGMGSLNRMLSGTTGVTPTAINVNRIASQMSVGAESSRLGEQPAVERAPITSFTQINNSPKDLNRLELYRQTKNLLSQQKGRVEGA